MYDMIENIDQQVSAYYDMMKKSDEETSVSTEYDLMALAEICHRLS